MTARTRIRPLLYLMPVVCAFLSACAGYGGRGLQVGISTLRDIEQLMGLPAMRWEKPDRGKILLYPRGPMGFHTWRIETDAAGHLLDQRNLLEPGQFARIELGMDESTVLQLLGPPTPAWTVYFAARDELVWEWRYCDDWSEPARFNVLFDGTTHRVRSTLAASENQRGLSVDDHDRAWCSR